MAYIRKTIDTWEIQSYWNGWECVYTATSRKEALSILKDYRENEPNISHKIVYKRERIIK